MNRLVMLALGALVGMPMRAQAQDTPQRHQTAAIGLRNGAIGVWSIDSGGARTVVIEAAQTTADSVLEHPRGGRWHAPAASVAEFATSLLGALDAMAAGAQPVDISLGWPTGPVRTAVVRCTLTTGCALTVTNRTVAGATRAGSWTTSPRLTVTQTRSLALALRTAALHDTDAMLTWVQP